MKAKTLGDLLLAGAIALTFSAPAFAQGTPPAPAASSTAAPAAPAAPEKAGETKSPTETKKPTKKTSKKASTKKGKTAAVAPSTEEKKAQ